MMLNMSCDSVDIRVLKSKNFIINLVLILHRFFLRKAAEFVVIRFPRARVPKHRRAESELLLSRQ